MFIQNVILSTTWRYDNCHWNLHNVQKMSESQIFCPSPKCFAYSCTLVTPSPRKSTTLPRLENFLSWKFFRSFHTLFLQYINFFKEKTQIMIIQLVKQLLKYCKLFVCGIRKRSKNFGPRLETPKTFQGEGGSLKCTSKVKVVL